MAISSMNNSGSREVAESGESEGIYFDDGQEGRNHQQTSLLGQALQQSPSSMEGPVSKDSSYYGSSNGNGNGRSHNHHERRQQYHSMRGGHRSHHNNDNSSNSSLNSSSLKTKSANNLRSSSQDSIYLSNRSTQSDDSITMFQHSVDTVPTSNVATFHQYQKMQQGNNQKQNNHDALKRAQQYSQQPTRYCASPPPELTYRNSTVAPRQVVDPLKDNNHDHHRNAAEDHSNTRRSVFGGRVRQRYPKPSYIGAAPQDPAPFYNVIEDGHRVTYRKAAQQPPNWKTIAAPAPSPPSEPVESSSPPTVIIAKEKSTSESENTAENSTLTPPGSPRLGPIHKSSSIESEGGADMISPLQSPPLLNAGNEILQSNEWKRKGRRRKHSSSHYNSKFTTRPLKVHETVHAQSLLLGLCFMAIWSPNNIMAPNLTQIAMYYNMTESERDLYLGSFLALATGVLSFPLSALIGIMTDIYSRKRLFVATAMGGAISAVATGMSPTYPYLLLARFFSGGFMSASVSVAFSLMGDLFATEERNAASSGLTAMMGLGIVLGQVYAGSIGNTMGWQHAFFVSSGMTVISGLGVAIWVQEPIRGGKEKVLQDMLQQGKRYDRKLTWRGFWHAMMHNRSNFILMAQGFFSSLPWGIIFVFLNDYLSQERGFSVPDATFIVLLFGVGCAIGGILGGYMGAWIQSINRTFLPLFMSLTTVLGVLPFLGLLNGHTTNAHGLWAMMYSIMGGLIASMPAVNVRPCLINVNPPETRGASLTAANLIVNLARGIGPCCITIMGSIFRVSRQVSFNVTLVVFWVISAVQLCCLAQSLPHDQDKMEAELAHYAASAMAATTPSAGLEFVGFEGSGLPVTYSETPDRPESSKSLDEHTLLSIEDRMTTFDGTAARESLSFFQKGMSEITFTRGNFCAAPGPGEKRSEEDDDDYYYEDSDEGPTPAPSSNNLLEYPQHYDDNANPMDMLRRRDHWMRQQQRLYGTTQDTLDEGAPEDGGNEDKEHPNETTMLL